jgi:hypothetical protein
LSTFRVAGGHEEEEVEVEVTIPMQALRRRSAVIRMPST